MKNWETAMDDEDPHDDYPIVPWPEQHHPKNCRCTLIVIPEWEWMVELRDTMNRVIGDTDPRTPEFKREYRGILHG